MDKNVEVTDIFLWVYPPKLLKKVLVGEVGK